MNMMNWNKNFYKRLKFIIIVIYREKLLINGYYMSKTPKKSDKMKQVTQI